MINDGSSANEIITYDNINSKKINYGGIRLGRGGESVKMISIDSLRLHNVQFIKVDVEGAEPLVFFGAKKTIKRCKPMILFEKTYKGITKDMVNSLSLKQNVVNFSIEEYCRSIGYSKAYPLNPGSDYLLLYKHDISRLINANIQAYDETAVFSKDNSNEYILVLKDNENEKISRGPFPVWTLSEDLILVLFTDFNVSFQGKITSDRITWDNGTTWFIK